MNDKTLSDLDGIELDAEVAQRILDSGDEYSQQTANLAQFIYNHKKAFREQLIGNNLIQFASSTLDGFDLAVVDGASAINAHGGGALVAAVSYKSSLNDDKQRSTFNSVSLPNSTDIDAFATLLRIHLELLLLTSNKLDVDNIVVLDHSFWGVMQAVSRALAAYKSQRKRMIEAKQNPDNHAMQVAWKKLFKECLGVDGSFLEMMQNKQVISLSKTGISQFFVNLLLEAQIPNNSEALILASNLNDRALLRHILEAGEYTTPQSIYRTEQDTKAGRKRSRFVTNFESDDGFDPFEARDSVLDEYGVPTDSDNERQRNEIEGRRLFVTYYRPHNWSRVYRIEFHELMLSNRNAPKDFSGRGERFQRVLASVRQSISPEAMEPACQLLADMRAKAAVSVAVSALPERTFYQLREQYRSSPDMLEIVDTLIAEERT